MNKLLILVLLLVGFSVAAQIAPDKYFVEFNDKNGTPYSIDHPEEFLSARAIDRRIRHSVVTKDEDLPVNPAYVDAVAATGVIVLNRTKWFNGVTIYTTDQTALVAITALPFVKQVLKSSGYRRIEPHPGILDKFRVESGLSVVENINRGMKRSAGTTDDDYGRAFNQIHMMKGEVLHNLGFKGQDMVIAVLDAGFLNADVLPVFDSLRMNGRILGTRDFVLPGNDVYREYLHGMSVLSTMGGNIPGEIIGTAPEASYWLFRTEDANSENIIEEYNWVSGAEAADSVGADVINSSLGYTTFDDSSWDHTWADLNGHTVPATRGANIAASKGIAVINSAGNSGEAPWRYISAPSDGDAVLSIGAVDSIGNYATFSSHGFPSGRIKPDVAAQGRRAWVAGPDSGFLYSSGTSFSSPIMAGMVACLWQSKPGISVEDLYTAIHRSASHFNQPDTLTGYGIPDFSVALGYLGINAGSADKQISVYPDPFTEYISIRCYSIQGEELSVNLYNEMGINVFRNKYFLHPGQNLIRVILKKNYPAGVYILALTSETLTETHRLIKIVK